MALDTSNDKPTKARGAKKPAASKTAAKTPATGSAASLKPLSEDWIPAGGVDDFGSAIRKVKSEADDDVKEDDSP